MFCDPVLLVVYVICVVCVVVAALLSVVVCLLLTYFDVCVSLLSFRLMHFEFTTIYSTQTLITNRVVMTVWSFFMVLLSAVQTKRAAVVWWRPETFFFWFCIT
jgi:hypothetical protein